MALSRKLRNDFAGRSTGSGGTGYYETKGHAVNAFDNELQTYDLQFVRTDLIDFSGDTGRKVIDIINESDECVGSAVLSWYRMPSGRYEFTGYLT